jgi:integrin-linked kinase-associated serine/threonine phosphatase 2C
VRHAFYAVFDGHGGREAAIMAEKIFLTHLLNPEEFPNIAHVESIKKAYAKTEEDILKRAVAES